MSDTSSWKTLYEHATTLRAESLQREIRAERRARAQRDFDAWRGAATRQALIALHEIACSRARELESRSGWAIEVAPLAEHPWPGALPGAGFGSVGLRLGSRAAWIYSATGPGGLPALHVLHGQSGGRRPPLLLSSPGVLLVRSGDAYALRRLAPHGRRLVAEPEAADALILRTFSLLLEAASRTRPN